MQAITNKEWDLLSVLARDVAGEGRAGLVLRALEGRVFVDCAAKRAALHFNETIGRLDKIVLPPNSSPYVLIHEFGHAYHCYFWPHTTAAMKPEMIAAGCTRAEAVALAFELELLGVAQTRYVVTPPADFLWMRHLASGRITMARRAVWATLREPFDIVQRMVQTAETDDLHDLVGRILGNG